MDDILILLLKMGAHRNPVKLSTIELGKLLNMSQQNASKRLQKLEEANYISRGKKIKLTKKAIEELKELHEILNAAFEEKYLCGQVTTGLGEGKYYMSLKGYVNQITKHLFKPYPGTLNLKVRDEDKWKRDLIMRDAIHIKGFKQGKRTFGDIYVYPCEIEGESGAIVMPIRTTHSKDIIELIAPFHIRSKMNKKDGDIIKVKI